MKPPQENARNCGNCYFSEKIPPTSMNDIPDAEEVKCSIDDCGHYATDEACNKWKPNCCYYKPDRDESKQCTAPDGFGFALGAHEPGGKMKNKGEQGGKPCEPDSCEYYEPKSQHQKQ